MNLCDREPVADQGGKQLKRDAAGAAGEEERLSTSLGTVGDEGKPAAADVVELFDGNHSGSRSRKTVIARDDGPVLEPVKIYSYPKDTFAENGQQLAGRDVPWHSPSRRLCGGG